jgi:hypothetical protein
MLGSGFLRRSGLVALLVVILSLTLAVILRKDIAVRVVTGILEAQGLQVTSLEVTQLDLRRTSLTGLVAEAPGFSARFARIDLDYSLSGLLAGKLPAVVLSGSNLFLDVDSPWLKDRLAGQGESPPSSPDRDAGAQGLLPIPDITLETAALRLITPLGPLELTAKGSLKRDPAAALIGSFDLAARSAQGGSAARIELTATPDRSLRADMVLEEGNIDIGGLRLRGLIGDIAVTFDGPSGVLARLNSELTLARLEGALSPSTHLAPLRVSMTAALEEADVVFAVAVASSDSPAGAKPEGAKASGLGKAEVTGRISQNADGIRISASGSIETPAALPLFSRFAFPLPETGHLNAQTDFEAQFPPLTDLQDKVSLAAAPERWLEMVTSASAVFSLQMERLSHSGYFSGLSSELAGRLALDDVELTLSLSSPFSARVEALSRTLLERFSLTDDLRGWLDTPLQMMLAAHGGEPLLRVARADAIDGPYALAVMTGLSGKNLSLESTVTGTLNPAGQSWSVSGPLTLTARDLPFRSFGGTAGNIELGLGGDFASSPQKADFTGGLTARAKELVNNEMKAGGVAVVAPIHADWSGEVLRAALTAASRITADSVTAGPLTSTTALQVDVTSGDVVFDPAIPSIRPNAKAVLAATGFSLATDTKAFAGEIAPIDIVISPGEGIILLDGKTAGITLPDLELRAADLHLKAMVHSADGAVEGRVNSLKIEDLAQTRRFEEVLLNAVFKRNTAGRVDFTAEGKTFQESVSFEAKGSSDPGRGTFVDVTLPPHDFAAKPLRVKSLSWLSDTLIDRGAFAGQVHIETSPEGSSGTARISGGGLGGQGNGFPFSGLAFDVDLDNLWPPQTTVPLTVSLAGVNPGLPVSNLRVEAGLREASPFTLELRDATLSVLGTEFSISDGRVALLDGTADLPIRITGLDLAEILKLAALEDVEVSGSLTGDLPITLDNGKVTIAPSKLSATEPGILRIRSEVAGSLLSGYGAEVDSLLRALEDFHYEDLALTIDKTAADDLTLLLTVLGNNPAVLEGQPFRINLNLESNIGQVLGTLADSMTLSKELLSGRYSLE